MCIQLWFNKMSEGDLGQLLWGIITFYREPGSRCSAKWWSDICAYYVTYKLHYKADAVGGCGWWYFNGSCDLLYIICMSTSPRMEQKQRDNTQQKSAWLCQKNNKGKHWSVSPARHLMPIQTYIKNRRHEDSEAKSHFFPAQNAKGAFLIRKGS